MYYGIVQVVNRISLVSMAMFSRARGEKTFPGMHCGQVLRTFFEVVTEIKETDCFHLFIDTASPR